jgi:hypothetical protein
MGPEPQKNKEAEYPEQDDSRNEPLGDGDKIRESNHIKDMPDQKGNQAHPKYFVPGRLRRHPRQAKNQADEDEFPVGWDRRLQKGNENKEGERIVLTINRGLCSSRFS